MSNTYKYKDLDGDVVRIRPSGERAETALVKVIEAGVFVPKDEAPAAALALLQAAGWTEDYVLGVPGDATGQAIYYLRVHVKEAAEAKTRAEDDAQLEAEALRLYRAATGERGAEFREDVAGLGYAPKGRYRAIALEARKIAAEKAE